MTPKPETVLILNLRYAITFAADLDDLGETHFRRQLIVINDMISPAAKADTLLHEILHALVYLMGLDGISREDDEDLVGRIATGLCTVWLNNPQVFDWIREQIHPPA